MNYQEMIKMQMKMTEKFAKQLNAEELKPEGNVFEWVECKEHKTKKGNTIQAAYFLGKQGEFSGDFFIPLFRIKNLAELFKQFGADDVAYRGKLFTIIPALPDVILKW
jgi:hypothetical protein